MAIDTEDKRRSAASFALPTIYPVPDASIDDADRAHIAGHYHRAGGPGVLISLVASRTQDFAPLSVHFDASGTTATGVTYPFHELEYKWNFGDSGAGNWTYPDTSRSKNEAIGPVAVHVFETPGGPYTVTLDVRNPANSESAQDTVSITVDDPDSTFSSTNTIVFSNDTDFTGKPSGATEVTTSDYASAINTYLADGKRLLFKRGDAFTTSSSISINFSSVSTGALVGAFGSGAKPTVTHTTGGQIHPMGGGTGKTERIVFMDLDVDCGSTSNDISFLNDEGGSTGRMDNILCFRIDTSNAGSGVMTFDSTALGTSSADFSHYCGAVECTQSGNAASWRWNIWGRGNFLLGCDFDCTNAGGHGMRCGLWHKDVFAYNRITDAASAVHHLKLHSPNWAGSTGGSDFDEYSELSIVGWNLLDQGFAQTALQVAAINSDKDNRMRDLIIDGNIIKTNGTSCNRAARVDCLRCTIRNNIHDGDLYNSSNVNHGGFRLTNSGNRHPDFPPGDYWCVNNTFDDRASGDSLRAFVLAYSGLGDVLVANNIVFRSVSPDAAYVEVTPTGTLTETTNFETTSEPGFSTVPPVNPQDFAITTSSSAKDAGTASIYATLDWLDVTRPVGSSYDQGAFEFVPAGAGDPVLAMNSYRKRRV